MDFKRVLLGDGTPAIILQDQQGLRLLTCDGTDVLAAAIEGVDCSLDSIFRVSPEYRGRLGLGFLRGEATPLLRTFLCAEWTGGKWLVTDLTDALLSCTADEIRVLTSDLNAVMAFGWRFDDGSCPGLQDEEREVTLPDTSGMRKALAEFFGGDVEVLADHVIIKHQLLLKQVLPLIPEPISLPPGRAIYAVIAREYDNEYSFTRLVATFGDEATAFGLAEQAQNASDRLRDRYGNADDAGWPNGGNPFDPQQEGVAHYSVEVVPWMGSGDPPP
jgi:hypothetical protein